MIGFKKTLSLIMGLTLSLILTTPSLAQNMAKPGKYSSIVTGENCVAVIDENDSLWMWGNNDYGQL